MTPPDTDLLERAPQSINETLNDIFEQDFWQDFSPHFSLEARQDDYVLALSEDEKARNKERVLREGYTHLKQPGSKLPIAHMAALFEDLVARGLPPVFAFVYDEFWMLSGQLHNVVDGVLDHEYKMLPDFWAWYIPPGQSGFKPHRDKGPNCLFPDRTPKSITAWLPLTQAHPLNGCMYIVPADRDPLYGVGQGFGGTLPDIRALPADPGDVFIWTQHAMHWSAHAADDHDMQPRMSVAFEYQRTDVPAFNTPLLEPGTIPPFDMRLALIAKQVLQYKHLYDPKPELLNLAQTIINRLMPPEQHVQKNTYGV